MKTIEEIISQEPVFLNLFSDEEGVFSEFNAYKDGYNVLFASYGNANYSGDAWVLLEKGNTLYEASGSHCSCYGLEGQFEPEEVNLNEIENRIINGNLGTDRYSDNNFQSELKSFLGINS